MNTNKELDMWMSHIKDDITLDRLSIPGTHNSGTLNVEYESARTQNRDIPQQLHDGIRMLDLRVRPHIDKEKEDGNLHIYHNVIDCFFTSQHSITKLCHVSTRTSL